MIGLLNFKKTTRVFREVKNFFFILNAIEKNRHSEDWKKYKLRSDWVGRIYTVISLSVEDMGEQEEVKRFKVLEKMRNVNEYLESLQLSEILIPNITPVDESRSYLVVYTPYFAQLSYIWMGINLFLPLGLIYEFILKG
jgi:hypothetical protein